MNQCIPLGQLLIPFGDVFWRTDTLVRIVFVEAVAVAVVQVIVLADVALFVVENVVQLILIVLLLVQLIPFVNDVLVIVQFLKSTMKRKIGRVKRFLDSDGAGLHLHYFYIPV